MARKKGDVETMLNPFVEFEEIDRPINTRRPWAITPQVEQIVKTVESGKAYRAKFRDAEDLKRVQMALRHAVDKKQLSLHYSKQADDTLLLWADKKVERQGKPGRK